MPTSDAFYRPPCFGRPMSDPVLHHTTHPISSIYPSHNEKHFSGTSILPRHGPPRSAMPFFRITVTLSLETHSIVGVLRMPCVNFDLQNIPNWRYENQGLVRAMLQKFSTQVADCYERAGESRAKAAAAANENDKTEYLNIERRWIMLARSYELSERITGFAEEVKRRLRVLIPPAPPHPAVPRLTCDNCGRRMRLTHIEPVMKNGHVTNASAFACKCGFTCRQVAEG